MYQRKSQIALRMILLSVGECFIVVPCYDSFINIVQEQVEKATDSLQCVEGLGEE